MATRADENTERLKWRKDKKLYNRISGPKQPLKPLIRLCIFFVIIMRSVHYLSTNQLLLALCSSSSLKLFGSQRQFFFSKRLQRKIT